MSQSNRRNPRRAATSESRYSFYEFDRDFPDDAACLEWLVGHLYPGGITCPKCQKVTPHYRVKARACFACEHCGHHEYPMAGTIFENSSTSLRLWFHGFFLMSQTRCGISAKQLERELGVTYKTAWRMFNKIRSVLADDVNTPLSGEVEMDETYVGGKPRQSDVARWAVTTRPNTTARRQAAQQWSMDSKTPVFGLVERRGRVSAHVVPKPPRKAIMGHIAARVDRSSTLYTDDARIYASLDKDGWEHRTINHSARIYVQGDVHTQTIEGFWSLVKRGIDGVYHSVSAKWLQSYVDEYTFRYNHRQEAAGMFDAFLSRIAKVAPAAAS
jgi:transposase-like protein